MVEIITMTKPSKSTKKQLREDIKELKRMVAEREEELERRNARQAAKAERYPDSRQIEKKWRSNPYERTRAAVYATGNKWAIENFEATHY